MRTRLGVVSRVGAAVVAASLCWSQFALAQTSHYTKFGGMADVTGNISRTIIDIEPNGPGGGVIQNHLTVTLAVIAGTPAPDIASAFEAASNAQIGDDGFEARLCNPVTVKLTKKDNGTFGVSDTPVTGVTMDPVGPCPEIVPVASPTSLALLAAGLSALALWTRRRKQVA